MDANNIFITMRGVTKCGNGHWYPVALNVHVEGAELKVKEIVDRDCPMCDGQGLNAPTEGN